MNKKVIIYFISSFLVISSAAVYQVLRELYISEDTYVMTGEYDVWIEDPGASSEPYLQNSDTEINTASENYVLIDINKASAEELMKLKGVGKKIAENIISYRQSAGGFSDIEEIKNVKGIGEKTFLALKEHIYVVRQDTSDG